MDELIKAFSLERVSKGGARFDQQKAQNMNAHYLQLKDDAYLANLFMEQLSKKGIIAEKEYVTKVVSLIKERVSFVPEMWEQASFFFEASTEYDAKTVKKRWKEQTPELMKQLIGVLEATEPFSSAKTEEQVKGWIQANELGMGAVMNAFRLAVVGASKGPHMFDIIDMLGKKETINRIEKAVEVLG